MSRKDIEQYLLRDQQMLDWWIGRQKSAAWNDDGRGGHIKAEPQIEWYSARVALLKELTSKSKF